MHYEVVITYPRKAYLGRTWVSLHPTSGRLYLDPNPRLTCSLEDAQNALLQVLEHYEDEPADWQVTIRPVTPTH